MMLEACTLVTLLRSFPVTEVVSLLYETDVGKLGQNKALSFWLALLASALE